MNFHRGRGGHFPPRGGHRGGTGGYGRGGQRGGYMHAPGGHFQQQQHFGQAPPPPPPVPGQGITQQPAPATAVPAQRVPAQQPQQPPVNALAAQFEAAVQALLNSSDFVGTDSEGQVEAIGECIYAFVEQLVGDDNAPKVTGMLVDLPLEDLRHIITNFTLFKEKVNEGANLLSSEDPASQ